MIRQSVRNSRMPGGRTGLLFVWLVVLVPTVTAFAGSSETRPSPPINAPAANDGRLIGGDFRIDGVPREYQAGKTYPVTVTIAQPGQSAWGFELTARFAESGSQAGAWNATDTMTRVNDESGIQYARHTETGSRKGTRDGPVEFHLSWTAPDNAGGLVIFNATGHARGDGSGDFSYTAGNFTRPAAAATQTQEPEPVEVDATPVDKPTRLRDVSRVVNLPAPVNLNKGSVEIMIEHRFLQSVDNAGAGDAFGIDSGANISLGMNYALTDRVSAGLARTRFDKIVELSGTYEIRTSEESNWKLAVRGGVEGRDNFHEHYSPFVQLAGSVDYRMFRLNVVPTMTFNSRPDELLEFNRDRAINPDSNHTFSLGVGADIAVSRRISLVGEYVPRLAGFGGLDRRRDHIAGGFVIRTWGHVFTIVVGTSRDFTPAKYAVNAEDRSFSLGFNLYRRIR